MMDLRTLDAHFRRDGADFLAIWTTSPFAPLLEEIARRTSSEQTLFFVDGEAMRRFARTQSARFAGLLGSLAALALAFAGIGMLSLIASRIAASRHELGLLHSVGATPNEIRLLVAAEASCFAALGVACGLALGVVSGPIASDLLGESVGWLISPRLPWGEIAIVAMAAFSAAVAASTAPAVALTRLAASSARPS
jgi:ABC-type antimicrobial peptide transport system permease subunit